MPSIETLIVSPSVMLVTVANWVEAEGWNAGSVTMPGEAGPLAPGDSPVSGDASTPLRGVGACDALELERAMFESALKPSSAARRMIAIRVSVRSGRPASTRRRRTCSVGAGVATGGAVAVVVPGARCAPATLAATGSGDGS